MFFLNMHFRLGNYKYMDGNYLQLVMKGSRHRGWDQNWDHTNLAKIQNTWSYCTQS
jgi:hypothetical protein